MNEIPGFFTSVNLSWNVAYPWEIRHDYDGVDRDINEYPHILDVSCEFQPVHNFAPSNSVSTPFILPDVNVAETRKFAKQADNEDQTQFNQNGVASDPSTAQPAAGNDPDVDPNAYFFNVYPEESEEIAPDRDPNATFFD